MSFSNPNKIYDQQDTFPQPLKRGGEPILNTAVHLFIWKIKYGKVRIAGCISRFKWEHALSGYIKFWLIMAKVEVGIVWSLN